MAKIKQTTDDLYVQLKDQIAFLFSSCTNFDKGHEAEAKRLATSIRILVHDTKNSKSLLRQLGVKSDSGDDPDDIPFADTARKHDPRNLMEQKSFNGLVAMYLGSGIRYVAPLSQPAHGYILKSTFPNWWNKIVLTDADKNNFSRRDLILSVADQDGGAHVDAELDERYVRLQRENSLGWVIGKEGAEDRPFPGPVFPSIRQIAHEVLLSLQNGFPEHFSASTTNTF